MSTKDDWERVKFGDVVRNVSESVPDPSASGLERAVGLEHLDPGELAIQRWASTDEGLTFTRRFRAGQVLFGRRRAYQRKVALPNFDGVCSGDIYVLESRTDRLLPELLPFIVQSEPFFDYALRTSAGSLSPRTKWADLKNYEFDLPPIDEQREMATVLRGAELTVRRYRDTETAVTGLLRAVAAEVFAIDRSRPTKRLHELCTAIIDCEHKTAPSGAGSARVVGTPDIRSGIINLASARTVSDSTFIEWTRRGIPMPGDLILTREAPVGEAAVVQENMRVCLGQRTVLIRPDLGVVYSEFLHLCLLSQAVQRTMERIAAGTTTPHLNVADIKILEVPKPPSLQGQQAAVSRASELRRLLEVLERQIESLVTLKRTVLRASLGRA